MLDHLATYALAYLLAFAVLSTGFFMYCDYKDGVISNPFKKQ